jgi:hypothetical protein
MSQPVGVLALRIWRDEDGEIRARVMAKLDALDPTAAETSHHSSTDAIDAAVASWVRRYFAFTNRAENQRS